MSRKKESNFFALAVIPIIFALLFPMWKTLQAGDPLEYMLPNLLLFTPFREQAKAAWFRVVKINKAVKRSPTHVPVIAAEDYTFEGMREATENWRYPAIVRGFFNGTPAQEKWVTLDYLPSRLGKFSVPVVKSALVGKLQNDRSIEKFGDAFRDLMTDDNSKAYLFFPVKSRFNFNGSDLGSLEALQKEVDDIVLHDLELHRIWNGFGTKAHSTYFGGQIIIGKGSDDDAQTTGTGWHCAAGNNWFAQVVGGKRWYFMDPKYSAHMFPLRGGRVNMMTGNRNMAELHDSLTLRYADVYAGDLLYNPDWEWHTIRNHKGLSIGCPIREVNLTLSFQNNFQYTSIVSINKLLERFGLDIGGYPPN